MNTYSTIEFNPNFAPELLVSSNPTSKVLNYVWLDEKEKAFVATNGSAMTIIPVITEINIPIEGFYSVAQIKKAKKLGKKTNLARLIVTDTSILFADGSSEPRLQAKDIGTFPQYKQAVPTKAPSFSVGLDAELLLRIAKSLGATSATNRKGLNVVLEFIDNLVPVTISLPGKTGMKGVLMPVKIKK